MKKLEDPKSLLVRKAKKLGITTCKPASKFASWRSRKQKRELRRAGQLPPPPPVALSVAEREELERIRSTVRERRLYHQLVLLKKAAKKAQQLEYRKAMRSAKKASAPQASAQASDITVEGGGDGSAGQEVGRKHKGANRKAHGGSKQEQLAAAIKAASLDLVVHRLGAEVGLPASFMQGGGGGGAPLDPLMEAAVARLLRARCVRDQVAVAKLAVDNPVGRAAKKAASGARTAAPSLAHGVLGGSSGCEGTVREQRGAAGGELLSARRDGGGHAEDGETLWSGHDGGSDGEQERSDEGRGQGGGSDRDPGLASISDISLSDEGGDGGASDYSDDDVGDDVGDDDGDDDGDDEGKGRVEGDVDGSSGEDGGGGRHADQGGKDMGGAHHKRKGGGGDGATGKQLRSGESIKGESGKWHGGVSPGANLGAGAAKSQKRTKDGAKAGQGERGGAKKPPKKKNRLGQRARRLQQEMLGSNGKGLQEGFNSKSQTAHARPHEHRSAVAHGRSKNLASKQEVRGNRRAPPTTSHAKAQDKNKLQELASKRGDVRSGLPEVLHPSWEAKRKQMEAVQMAVSLRGSGKKVVFGDDSD